MPALTHSACTALNGATLPRSLILSLILTLTLPPPLTRSRTPLPPSARHTPEE